MIRRHHSVQSSIPSYPFRPVKTVIKREFNFCCVFHPSARPRVSYALTSRRTLPLGLLVSGFGNSSLLLSPPSRRVRACRSWRNRRPAQALGMRTRDAKPIGRSRRDRRLDECPPVSRQPATPTVEPVAGLSRGRGRPRPQSCVSFSLETRDRGPPLRRSRRDRPTGCKTLSVGDRSRTFHGT